MSTQKNNAMCVSDVMLPLERIPVIGETVILKEALEEMNRSSLGIACIVNVDTKLLGILTDGDIRRRRDDLVQGLGSRCTRAVGAGCPADHG